MDLELINYPGIWCDEDDLYNVNLDGSAADWSFAIGFKQVPNSMHSNKQILIPVFTAHLPEYP